MFAYWTEVESQNRQREIARRAEQVRRGGQPGRRFRWFPGRAG